MATYSQRWETAKNNFTSATGQKKPSPKGFFKEFFNYTSLTGSLKNMDTAVTTFNNAKPADKLKAIDDTDKKVAALDGSINTYLKVLEASAKDEKAENNAKTELYRHLKVLSAELKAISAHAQQFADSARIGLDQATTAKEKAAKIMKTSLASACANANLAIKAVAAAPTPAMFAKHFTVSDPPGRKIQVQLISAKKQVDDGKIPVGLQDPGVLANLFTAWQAQNSANNVMTPTSTPDQVKARLEAFKAPFKKAMAYSDSL